MPRLPFPLAVREWRAVSRQYYTWVLDPTASGGGFPVVAVPSGQAGFTMKDYVGASPSSEALACLSAVIGARLVGLDPRCLHGVNYVDRAKAWYDPALGLARNTPTDRSPVVHADIYGYWAAILGMELAWQYPDDPELRREADTAPQAFLKIAHGLGAPDHPQFDVLGWDFSQNAPGGRPERMNRLGHAPSVAWVLMAGAARTGNLEMLRCARATMRWYVDHPGRYEISHVMGPLTAARLNSLGGEQIDIDRVFRAWFGEGDLDHHPWGITAGTDFQGLTADGLDSARRPDSRFYAFTMGTLQIQPGWCRLRATTSVMPGLSPGSPCTRQIRLGCCRGKAWTLTTRTTRTGRPDGIRVACCFTRD